MSDYYIFVGTYSPAAEQGIHLLRFESGSGRLTRIGGTGGIENASFLTADERRRLLFSVSETGEGAIVSYRYDLESGSITELSRQPTYGAAPCYVSTDASGSWLYTVNYTSGSIVLYPVHADGTIGEAAERIEHHGSSIRSDRQMEPHPHAIVPMPDSPYWLVPDLGTDTLYVYRHDPVRGKLIEHARVRTEPGAGPRHAAFHPSEPYVYVINELDSTIVSYRYDPAEGTMTAAHVVHTLPEGYSGESTCADIHVDETGSFVYGSNRGHDSIAVFRILEQGKLEPLGHVATGGRTPRNFTLVPGTPFVLAANQDSDSILVFELPLGSGVPQPAGQSMAIGKPVCLHVLTPQATGN